MQYDPLNGAERTFNSIYIKGLQMTDHFREAVDAVSKLPDKEQNRIADVMLGLAGKAAFGERRRYWIAGEMPDPEKIRKAIRGLREFRKDISLGGLSIRELINEGRH